MESFAATRILNMAGLAGVVLYLGSYALLQMGLLRGNGYAYSLLTLFAASFVLLSLTVAFNLSSVIIQISWILISIFGIACLVWINRNVRFSSDEHLFLQTVFPDMPRPTARRFLDRGTWISAEEGVVILIEDDPVLNLYYLASGEVQVISGGQVIGTVKQGLLGEMNAISGGPASATLEVCALARLFAISGNILRRMVLRDPEFRVLLENGMGRDTGRKLMFANERLSELSRDRT
ncbi:MAG: cyclic nucleotide-binding domain-containing protein [Roseinatronobacter sp.]